MTNTDGSARHCAWPLHHGGARNCALVRVAPTTGIFAQVGKGDIGRWLPKYEVKNVFGGAQVKFIVEDEQAKPTLTQEATRAHAGRRWPLGVSLVNALAPVSTAEKVLYAGFGGR